MWGRGRVFLDLMPRSMDQGLIDSISSKQGVGCLDGGTPNDPMPLLHVYPLEEKTPFRLPQKDTSSCLFPPDAWHKLEPSHPTHAEFVICDCVIENRLYWGHDATLGEDDSGGRLPPVAQILAVLNTMVLSLMDRHQVTNVARQI